MAIFDWRELFKKRLGQRSSQGQSYTLLQGLSPAQSDSDLTRDLPTFRRRARRRKPSLVFGLPVSKADLRLHFLCFYFGLGASVWGYHIGILSSILVHPGWLAVLGNPGPGQKGIITAIYYVGTWTSYVFLSYSLSDFLGRRYSALCGVVIVCLGAALEAACVEGFAVAMMIAGRIICGMGVAIVSTSVPLYQAEISPAKKRGKFVTMNHLGFLIGLAAGLWVGYAMRHWKTPQGIYWGWRVTILLQYFPALLFGSGLPFLPESPRWLVEHNHLDKADSTLHWLRDGSFELDEVEDELSEIQHSVEWYHSAGVNRLSLFRDPHLFARLWRAVLLQFMAQMCGATSMKYYLPTLLEALGLSTEAALMAGAAEMTLKIGCTVLEALIIDRIGRRWSLTTGCVFMAFSMLINAVLPMVYPDNSSKVADIVCIVFIFLYAFGYSIGFGPAAWVYATEVFPTVVRAPGLNFAASGGAIGSIIVAQVWPIGADHLGSKIYFFFMAVNLVCIPIIWLLYPETKGRSLEGMDELFGRMEGGAWRRLDISLLDRPA